MNCAGAVRHIQAFLDDELDIDELRGFIDHIDTCPECKEELTIGFLVREGLLSLESGEVFDLNRALDQRIAQSKRRLSLRENMKLLYYMISGLVVAETVTVVLMLVFLIR